MSEFAKSPDDPESEYSKPTAPGFQVHLLGFNEEDAQKFGNFIGETIIQVSCYIDLERLDGVTVAYEFDKALASLDRGYQSSRSLTRTENERLLGVAMAPAVLRDGIVKSHLMFLAPVVLPLMEGSGESFEHALYIVAHECGHIEELKYRDICFPGVILQERINDREAMVFDEIAPTLWEEYAACRISAPLGRAYTPLYEEAFVAALNRARNDANRAIRMYRKHADVSRVLKEAGRFSCEPLLLFAYLAGHLDGIEEDWNKVPAAKNALASTPYRPFIDRLRVGLRELWDHRGRWASWSELISLNDIVRDVLAHTGMFLKRLPDGSLYVDIPPSYARDFSLI